MLRFNKPPGDADTPVGERLMQHLTVWALTPVLLSSAPTLTHEGATLGQVIQLRLCYYMLLFPHLSEGK